jgi:hypothetical protein
MAWPEPRKTGMLYRRVGNSGLHVSVLGLGGWLTYVKDCFPFIPLRCGRSCFGGAFGFYGELGTF